MITPDEASAAEVTPATDGRAVGLLIEEYAQRFAKRCTLRALANSLVMEVAAHALSSFAPTPPGGRVELARKRLCDVLQHCSKISAIERQGARLARLSQALDKGLRAIRKSRARRARKGRKTS